MGALQQGAITVQNSNMVCGGGITIGNKFTRCMGSHGSPPLSYAITHSCDGYYYRLALKMKIEGLIEMVETFDFDKRTGIDIPNEKTSQTPKSGSPLENGKAWSDIRMFMLSGRHGRLHEIPFARLRSGMHGKKLSRTYERIPTIAAMGRKAVKLLAAGSIWF